MAATLERLTRRHAEPLVDLFCDAFHAYPVMRFVVGTAPERFDDRLHKLIDYFVSRRLAHGAPMFGLFDGGLLVGAATTTLPDEPEMPGSVHAKAADVWGAIGDDARERYEAYTLATKTFALTVPHHHLNMIGVRRAYQRRGLSRPLLDAVARLADADPASAGVTLTTEHPPNVQLYEHFGYRVIGHARVAPALETWGLFLERARQ
jgi:GNAT superfamily N-acetyltransferase